jgi:hypothetical protein
LIIGGARKPAGLAAEASQDPIKRLVAVQLALGNARAAFVRIRLAELATRSTPARVVAAADPFSRVDDQAHAGPAVRGIVAAIGVIPAELAERPASAQELTRLVTRTVVDAGARTTFLATVASFADRIAFRKNGAPAAVALAVATIRALRADLALAAARSAGETSPVGSTASRATVVARVARFTERAALACEHTERTVATIRTAVARAGAGVTLFAACCGG